MISFQNGKWRTKDGRELYLFEMSDAHLKNAKAMLERKLAAGGYEYPHTCMPTDIMDGPCYDCERNGQREGEWYEIIEAMDIELRRRAADAARRATP